MPPIVSKIEIIPSPRINMGEGRFEGPTYIFNFHIIPSLALYTLKYARFKLLPTGGVGNHGQGPDGWYQIKSLDGKIIFKVWPNGDLKITDTSPYYGGYKPEELKLPPDLTEKFRNYILNLQSDYNENNNVYGNEITPAVLVDDTLFINYDDERLERYVDEGGDMNACDGSGVNAFYVILRKAYETSEYFERDTREFLMRLIRKILAKNVKLDGITIGETPALEVVKSMAAYRGQSETPGSQLNFFKEFAQFILDNLEELKRLKRVQNTVHMRRMVGKTELPREMSSIIANYAVTEPIRPGNIGTLGYLQQRHAATAGPVAAVAAAGAGAAGPNARRRAEGGRSRKHRGGANNRRRSRVRKPMKK